MTLENVVRVVLAAAVLLSALLGMVVNAEHDGAIFTETGLPGLQTQFQLPSQSLACTGCSTSGGGPT